MLAVVEDDDERASGQVAHDKVGGRSRRPSAREGGGARPERRRRGRRHPVGLGHAGQLDQPGAVPVLVAQGGGRLDRQSGLARAARAGRRTSRLERTASRSWLSSASRPTKRLSRARRFRLAPAAPEPPADRSGLELAGKRRVLGQDAGLKFPQGRAGIDAQLIDQAVTDLGVGAQRFGLPSGPVQGEDQQFPQALAKRVLPAQRLQFAGEFPVAAQHQVRSGPGLDRHQGQLLQMRPLGIGEARVGELGQRLTAPQAERFTQRG